MPPESTLKARSAARRSAKIKTKPGIGFGRLRVFVSSVEAVAVPRFPGLPSDIPRHYTASRAALNKPFQ
jgi:hypothetical protein